MAGVMYSNVVDYMLISLPEIRSHYDKRATELYAYGLAHVVLGSIFVEHVRYLVEAADRAEDDCDKSATTNKINRAFALVEELVTSDDPETRNLVETSVLEALLGEVGGGKRFSSFMGPKTWALACELSRRMRLGR